MNIFAYDTVMWCVTTGAALLGAYIGLGASRDYSFAEDEMVFNRKKLCVRPLVGAVCGAALAFGVIAAYRAASDNEANACAKVSSVFRQNSNNTGVPATLTAGRPAVLTIPSMA